MLAVHALFDQLGSGTSSTAISACQGPSLRRSRLRVAGQRLTRPCSEHGLAGWLETDFVCDRQGRRFTPLWQQRGRVRVQPRQLGSWYRTLDYCSAAKGRMEVALYHRLRDLFSFQPDLVLFDITSTYFEGAGPKISPSTATAATASRRTSRSSWAW